MPYRVGERLNRQWKIGARHALYNKDGKWYHVMRKLPGASCDPYDYALFETESQFLNCERLRIGEEVNVKGHISDIPSYVRVRESEVYRG